MYMLQIQNLMFTKHNSYGINTQAGVFFFKQSAGLLYFEWPNVGKATTVGLGVGFFFVRMGAF
jgi:hypothetical protein